MKKINFNVCGLPAKYYIPFLVVILIASYLGTLESSIVGAVPYLMAVGGLFFWVGNTVPVLGSYLAGGCLLPLVGTSLMKLLGIIPQGTIDSVTVLMKTANYQNFYIAAILVGSIFSMDRKVLLGATARYLPAIIISQAFALGFTALGGLITGEGAAYSIFYIGAPCMSGGSGGAITTLPMTYSQLTGEDLMGLAGPFICYTSIANVIAVLTAGISSNIVDKFPSISGRGKILVEKEGKASNAMMTGQAEAGEKRPGTTSDFPKIGAGLFMSCVIYEAGTIVAYFIPQIAGIAWAIIIAILIKCSGILPEEVCDYATYWMNFMLKNGLPMLIAGLGITSLNLPDLTTYFSIGALIVIIMGIAGAVIGGMIGGKIMGLYPYETAVTAGLCSCDIGGSGDIAILTASNRLHLLAFSSISTRIGCALMVVWVSLLYPVLMM